MHAFLMLGSKAAINTKIEEKIAELKAKTLLLPLSKIADVRELSSFTKLKVIEETVIIVRDFDSATEETQNAFLKALEEPQSGLTYILTATNIQNILPTIVSRCEVVEVASSKQQVVREEKELIQKFINSKVGERLILISKINRREEAMEFINNLIIVGHESFLENAEAQLLDNANKTLRNLQVNGNVQLQLTNLVVNLNSLQIPESGV